MTNATAQKVDVRVGEWEPDGAFLGETVRFTGEEVGSWTEWPEIPGGHRVHTYTLYRTPDGEYRFHVERWSRWRGEGTRAWLAPAVAPEDVGPEETPPVYDTSSEENARRSHPHPFSALGMPNVRELD